MPCLTFSFFAPFEAVLLALLARAVDLELSALRLEADLRQF